MPELLTPERVFALGGKLPPGLVEAIAPTMGAALGTIPLPAWRQWEHNVAFVTGRRPARGGRRRLAAHWLRNNAWSMSLARWSDEDVLERVRIPERSVAALRESIDGPGLVLALPHMGSWDLAGAWCARVGIEVVSVAERLPRGLYERFRDARAGMGMRIHPMGEPHLLASLARHVEHRRMVCLLADRDLGNHGIPVRWPSGGSSRIAPGPAALAQRTGADLRVVTTHFDRRSLRLSVSAPVDTTGQLEKVCQRVADHFSAAIAADPTNWLVLQPLVR